MRHPNCVLFLGFTTPPNFCIVTEYLELGSLRSILNNPMIRLNTKIIIKIALSVARGMNYLHTQSPAIFHRDLNSHNILCHKNWIIKVADYGLSRTIDSAMEFCGAIPWQAPEVKSGLFLPESDVFSFGIILWELVTRELPWKGIEMQLVAKKIKNGERPLIPIDCPTILSDLMGKCWNQEAKSRPSFHQIIEILKPFENKSKFRNPSSFSSSTSSSSHVTTLPLDFDFNVPMETYLQEYEDLMMFGDSSAIICRCWEVLLNHKSTTAGEEFVTKHTLAMKSFISGSLCFMDSWGKMIWIVGLNSRESLEKEEQYIAKHRADIKEFSFHVVSPITRQTMKLTPFCLKPGATIAVSTQIKIQEGLGSESLKLFKETSIEVLKEFNENWCGTIVLSDSESTLITIITLFNCPSALEDLRSRGFFNQQMNAFQNLMADIPIFREYQVKQDTFHSIHYSNDSYLSDSDSSISPYCSLVSLPDLGFYSKDKKGDVDFAREPVLDSFFCLLNYNEETSVGHLFVCPEHIRFKGRASVCILFFIIFLVFIY